MRLSLPLAAVLLSACATQGSNGLPVLFPGLEITRAVSDPGYAQRRGAVEPYVKTNLSALLTGIAAGGSPEVTHAFDLAGIPAADRPARLIQLEGDRGLYEANPGALVSALMVYGG